MKKHKLITIPNTILRSKSKRLGVVNDQIKELVDQMAEITVAWDHDSELGVALAAIQVGEPIRLAIIRNGLENETQPDFTTFINPKIVKHSEDSVVDVEGCLSIPGVYGRVRRYSKIKVQALDINGNHVRITAKGFLARVFQHEIDHMNGVMFLDHITKLENLFSIDKDGKLTPLPKAPPGFEHIK